jgi:ABC-type nitrate/sulfonate/bicarbonate transport system ATPase subunit
VRSEAPEAEGREAVRYSYTALDLTVGYRLNRARAVLHNFSFDFQSGKIYALMGANGCGKSTLLRVLAGEMSPESGGVAFKGGPPGLARTIEYVPQDYRQALFPWKTVRDNVYPWRNGHRRVVFGDDGRPGSESEVDRALGEFGLKAFTGRSPNDLSGGQQQTLLLARCTVSNAAVVLLDEPFSALDVLRRSAVARALRERWHESHRVIICAMHEPDEAAMFADEILVFRGPPLRLGGVVEREAAAEGSASTHERLYNLIRDLAAGETNEQP